MMESFILIGQAAIMIAQVIGQDGIAQMLMYSHLPIVLKFAEMEFKQGLNTAMMETLMTIEDVM